MTDLLILFDSISFIRNVLHSYSINPTHYLQHDLYILNQYIHFQKQKKTKMSVTISNCNQICNSPTNLSKAKMLYTFKKQSRFPKKIRVLCDKFYNQPTAQGRSTSLGYGEKYDFTKDVPKSPSPNAYLTASDFDKDIKKGVGFGEGRQEMVITGPFMSTHKNKNPGPGNYQFKSTLSRTCYSMSGKNFIEDKQKIKTPGPGSYESSFGLSTKGKYFLAKHRSSCTRNFGHIGKRGSTLHTLTPGPGKYSSSTQQMSPQGRYFVSKMHNSLVRKFGTSLRQPLAPNNNTPGPGNYKLPSQFGHYLAKSAYENKRHGQKENQKSGQADNKENQS